MFWITLVVIGLVFYLFLGTERGNSVVIQPIEKSLEPQEIPTESVELQIEAQEELSEIVEEPIILPPGMNARLLIEQARKDVSADSLAELYQKALEHRREGNLADAHLLFFFSAREGYQPAIVTMAELSDPTLFRAEDNLLDQADAMQSYQWYLKVAEFDAVVAQQRIDGLHQWALDASKRGDPSARQFLLVIR